MAWQGAPPYYQDPNQPYGAGYPPNAGYPPPGGYPQGGFPQGGYPPGAGYPPTGGYAPPPQGGFPSQGGYPPPPHQPGFIPPQPDAAYGQSSNYGAYNDPEAQDDDVKGFAFTDQSIRRAFIRKVYTILMIQLSITTGFIALFVFHQPTRLFAFRHPEMFWVALVFMIVTLISMACCENVRRKSPMNIIFLMLFTIAESLLLGYSSARYDKMEVLLAVGITAVVCFALTLFALQTKWDFTVMGGALFVCLIVFVLFGFLAIFFHGKILSLVYASIGAVLFSIYLIYDTQLMLGGKHKYAISPEEYIFGALNLYVDIIQIFMYILTIIGASRD